MALTAVTMMGAACSGGGSGVQRSQIYRTSAPTPSPGDDLIDVPVVLGPTQQQLDTLNAKCGRLSGVVRAGIEPGMLFVEVYGFGPDNTQPVTDCVKQLPFYRQTGDGLVAHMPASKLLPVPSRTPQ